MENLKEIEEMDCAGSNSKIVVFKDGTHIVVADGISWEYENDANWLTTI